MRETEPDVAAWDVAAVRTLYPALEEGAAHFDGPGGSQTPAPVADAVAATLRAAVANRGPLTVASRRAEEVVVAARAAVADLLGADAAGVVFGRSMTQLTYDLARTLARGWGPGDEVVVTTLDHDANVSPWLQAAARAGATVRWVDFDPATGVLDAGAVADVIGPRTRLVALTGASNLIGSRPPVDEVARVARAAGARTYLDGVHLTPHAGVDLARLGVDAYVCSAYKFGGPHCSALAADPGWLAGLAPDKLEASTDAVPERFELGTLPYEHLAGTTAAVDVLAGWGRGASRRERILTAMDALDAHESRLRERIEAGVASLGRVTLHGAGAPQRTPTLLLSVDGVSPGAVAESLARRGVNAPAGSFYAHRAARRLGLGDAGGVRVGLAPYNDDGDVDRLLDALAGAVTDH